MEEKIETTNIFDLVKEQRRLAAITTLIDSIRPVSAELDRQYGIIRVES